MILIPEIIIKNTLDQLMKFVYDEYVARAGVGAVTNAADVDTGFTITTTTVGSLGVAGVTSVVTVADAGGSLNNKYFLINTPSRNFVVWYNVNNGGTAPATLTTKFPIMVRLSTGDTANVVAAKTAAAILLYAPIYFTTGVAANTLTVTNKETNGERRSLLYAFFGELTFDNAKWFYQIKNMLADTFGDEKRPIEILIGYSAERNKFPVICIMLPNEENSPKQVGTTTGTHNFFFNNETADMHQHTSQCTYNLLITSDNENEVLMLYHFFKTLMIAGIEQFHFQGLQNVYVTGRDVTLDFELIPMLSYHRSVSMTFHYENTHPELVRQNPATALNFIGTPVGAESSDTSIVINSFTAPLPTVNFSIFHGYLLVIAHWAEDEAFTINDGSVSIQVVNPDTNQPPFSIDLSGYLVPLNDGWYYRLSVFDILGQEIYSNVVQYEA